MGDDYFVIKFLLENELHKRLNVPLEILNRNDGSYIVRYRLNDNYENMIINIMTKDGLHIAKSPYFLKGVLTAENCDCPQADLNKWYQSIQCNQTYTQIEQDMKKFNNTKFDMNEIHEYITEKFNQRFSHSYCNYVVLDNKVGRFIHKFFEFSWMRLHKFF